MMDDRLMRWIFPALLLLALGWLFWRWELHIAGRGPGPDAPPPSPILESVENL